MPVRAWKFKSSLEHHGYSLVLATFLQENSRSWVTRAGSSASEGPVAFDKTVTNHRAIDRPSFKHPVGAAAYDGSERFRAIAYLKEF